MHLLLFERSAHFLRQLVEKLSHGAVVQVAGIYCGRTSPVKIATGSR
jgi:hypothetical protein